MTSSVPKAIAKAALTIAAALTGGALAYVNHGNPEGAVAAVVITAVVLGFLAFCSAAE